MSKTRQLFNGFAGVLVGASAVVLSGCDFLDMFFNRKAQIDAVVQQPPQPEVIQQQSATQESLKSNCAALKHFIATRLKILKNQQQEIVKELANIKSDRQKFSDRVKEISDANLADKNSSAASGLELLLSDGAINELAFKYLGKDFAVIRHEFAEKIRDAVAFEQKIQKEIEARRSSIEKSVTDSQAQVARARRENAAKIAQLKREIEANEKKIKRLRADLQHHSGQDVQYIRNANQEIRHVESTLSNLRSDLQREKLAQNVRDADRNLALAGTRASNDNKRLDEIKAQRMKGSATTVQITENYEKLTLHKLDSALLEANQAAQAKQKLLSEQALYLESVTTGLETLDSASLKRVRTEVEAELARTVEGVSKKGANGR